MTIKDLRLHEEPAARWLVTYLGKVRHDPGKGVRKCLVRLIKVNTDYDTYGNGIEREIEVGAIPRVSIGTIWDGTNTLVETYPKSGKWDYLTFKIQPGLLPEFIYDENKKLMFRYPFPFADKIRAVVTNHGDTKIIIPCHVIASHFFFSSTKLIHAIFNGKSEELYKVLAKQGGRNVLEVAKGFNKEVEIEHLVRLAYSDIYRDAAKFIHNSLMKSVSGPTSTSAWVSYGTKFPFTKEQSVEGFGLHYNWNGENYFLVSSILGTDLQWPVNDLQVLRAVENGKGEIVNDHNTREYTNRSYGVSTKENIDTSDSPSYMSGIKTITVKDERRKSKLIPERPDIKISEKEEQDGTYHGTNIKLDRNSDGASTYATNAGDTNLDRVEFKTEQSDEEATFVDDFIMRFGKIMSSLQKIEPSIKITYHKLEGYELYEEFYTLLPYKKYVADKSVADLSPELYRFLYYSKKVVKTLDDENVVDDNNLKVRRMVMAGIELKGKCFLVIEVDPVDYPLNTVMLYKPNLNGIGAETITSIIDNCMAHKGRWKFIDDQGIFDDSGLLSVRFNHENENIAVMPGPKSEDSNNNKPTIKKDETYVAQKIFKSMRGIINKATNI